MARLGGTDLDVSRIGLGCLSMSGNYGRADQIESTLAIQRGIELGVNFLDTADVYGNGHNEELVGRAIVGRRDRVVLATKFGHTVGIDGRIDGVDARPETVAARCEASLRRLRIDVIDLYYLHRVDPRVTIEETVGAMARLVEQGKVRHLGLSEASVANVRRAHSVHPIAALQTEYSLWYREPERELLPACRQLGIGFVAYAPLARGLFGAPFRSFDDLPPDDARRGHPRFSAENLDRNLELARALEALGQKKGRTAAQLALAWVLARGQDVVAIPGSKRRHRVEENAAAADIELTADEVALVEAAVPADAGAGERYPPDLMKLLDR
jgi:aryl-alcohol dehydrogenase-like predicted oxidoreductase